MKRLREMWFGALLLLLLGAPGVDLRAQQMIAAGVVERAQSVESDPLLQGTSRFEQGATDITEVNLDKAMMAMAAKFMDTSEGDIQKLMKKMEFVHVKTFEYQKEVHYQMADLEQFRERLDASWSHMVKERSATEATDVWVKADGDGQFSELMVIAAEPKELTFVHLKGHMTMDELTRAGASYGVPQSGAAQQSKNK